MRRLLPSLVALSLAGCAANFGAPKDIAVPTVAVRAAAGASSADVAAVLRDGSPKAAFLLGPTDSTWLASVAESTGLTLSGPANAGGTGLSFLAMKPVGDTIIDLEYTGGTYTVLDALYEIGDKRYLDLLSFRVDDGAHARAIIASLLQYVGTDVDPTAAVVMTVAVPTPAVGDSVARMLTPGFYDVLGCGDREVPSSASDGMRVFYGPEARVYCRSASAEQTGIGTVVHARLIAGRRE